MFWNSDKTTRVLLVSEVLHDLLQTRSGLARTLWMGASTLPKTPKNPSLRKSP